MKTVIMAGGQGTRISELFPDIPKPLIPIKDESGAHDYNICFEDSWMIGDGENDIKAGIAAGCHTALIRSEDAETVDETVTPEVVGTSLLEVVKKILA